MTNEECDKDIADSWAAYEKFRDDMSFIEIIDSKGVFINHVSSLRKRGKRKGIIQEYDVITE